MHIHTLNFVYYEIKPGYVMKSDLNSGLTVETFPV